MTFFLIVEFIHFLLTNGPDSEEPCLVEEKEGKQTKTTKK